MKGWLRLKGEKKHDNTISLGREDFERIWQLATRYEYSTMDAVRSAVWYISGECGDSE